MRVLHTSTTVENTPKPEGEVDLSLFFVSRILLYLKFGKVVCFYFRDLTGRSDGIIHGLGLAKV